jgi:hypothetical protein
MQVDQDLAAQVVLRMQQAMVVMVEPEHQILSQVLRLVMQAEAAAAAAQIHILEEQP